MQKKCSLYGFMLQYAYNSEHYFKHLHLNVDYLH